MSKFPVDMFPIGTPSAGGFFKTLGAVPVRMNELIVYFDFEPKVDDPEDFQSATTPENWTLTPFDPSTPSVGHPDTPFIAPNDRRPTYQPQISRAFVDAADTKQVHIRFNTPLEERVQYDLLASDRIRSILCRTMVPANNRMRALVRGVGHKPFLVTEDVYRDFAMEFFPRDPGQQEATWRHDSTTDIGIQNADESLRKRIYRRLFTGPGGFKFLGAGYGTDLRIKSLLRGGSMQSLANRVAEQARMEPDVRDASCEARLRFGTRGEEIVDLVVSVARIDKRESRFTIQVPGTALGI